MNLTKIYFVFIALLFFIIPGKKFGQEYPDNLAGYADITVSDEYSFEYGSQNAVDRVRGTDWVSGGDRDKWIFLSWPYPIDISYVKIMNRQTGVYDPIHSSELILSDGTVFYVGSIKTHGRKLVEVNKDGITWIKYLIKRGLNNVGLSEIVVVGE